ncbi:MAG: methyltransferase domain-containing protein, partial [Pyrinomonadaceae bacterium]
MAYDLDVEGAVRERYGNAAREAENALCCPVEYDPQFLRILPAEIIERDYGCGDPSRFVKTGETVLDLGSGGGKICYIAAQIVGASGKVIGIDTNTEMLALANEYRDEMAEKIGYGNTEFRYGKIQDLKLDLSLVNEYLEK